MRMLTLTNSSDAVEDVASLTLAAIGAQQVNTTVTPADLFRALTLVDICSEGAIVRKQNDDAYVNEEW